MGVFLERSSWVGKTVIECEHHRSIVWAPECSSFRHYFQIVVSIRPVACYHAFPDTKDRIRRLIAPLIFCTSGCWGVVQLAYTAFQKIYAYICVCIDKKKKGTPFHYKNCFGLGNQG